MSTDRVDIEFQDQGFGAAAVVLNVGDRTVSISPVSYSTHPLGDLLRVALTMAVGGECAHCLFEREPDQSRLELSREQDAERMRLVVWNIEVWGEPEKAPPDRKVFDVVCAVDAFASAVERAASTVLEAQGMVPYRKNWQWRFPVRALASLRAALQAQGPSADRRAPLPQLPAWE